MAVTMEGPATKYQALIELAPDPIFIISLETGIIQEVNEAASELLGYETAELEGENIATVHPPGDIEAYSDQFRPTIEAGEICIDSVNEDEPLYLVARDGSRIPVELHAKSVEIGDEPVIVLIARDVADRRERERALEHQNDQLEDFASIVSHDLRNPLSVASGRVELAQEECDSEHLETVRRALDRMETLIDHTLTLARVGEQVEDPEPVELGELLDSCWEMVATSEATFEADLEGTVRGDPSRLRQLFENLFRNAVEHGGETVTVRVGSLDDGLFVADDGPGIPAEKREDVFEPGYSSETEGTGFGLAIVESVVTAHGWEIAVTESERGGARFEVTGMAIEPPTS